MKKKHGFLVKVIDTLAMVHVVKDTGFDFVFYDLEHGVLPLNRLHDLILHGNAIGLDSWVRVCECTKQEVQKVADCGAKGIMCPMVETKEQAEQLVSLCKYPPIGHRSYAGGAQTHYAASGNHKQNMDQVNASMKAIVQIESIKAVGNLDEILSVPGVDCAIVGPVDLGISMRLIDKGNDPQLLETIATISKGCKKYGVAFGIIGSPSLCEVFKDVLDIEVDVNDVALLRDGLKRSHTRFLERV